VLLTAVAAACTGAGPSVPINQEFILAPGESTHVSGADIRLHFDRVTGDSRCPADAFCIQGGDAIVLIAVSSAWQQRRYELHTGDMQPVRHDDLTIELIQLSPYPFSAQPIQPGDYRATLRVRRS
jgi:hypothetical protein